MEWSGTVQAREQLSGGCGREHHVRRSVDRKSTRLNSSHRTKSYAVFCLKKKMSDVTPMTSSYRDRIMKSLCCLLQFTRAHLVSSPRHRKPLPRALWHPPFSSISL